jgi:hypothetical protein
MHTYDVGLKHYSTTSGNWDKPLNGVLLGSGLMPSHYTQTDKLLIGFWKTFPSVFFGPFCPVAFFRQMIALKITLKKTHF